MICPPNFTDCYLILPGTANKLHLILLYHMSTCVCRLCLYQQPRSKIFQTSNGNNKLYIYTYKRSYNYELFLVTPLQSSPIFSTPRVIDCSDNTTSPYDSTSRPDAFRLSEANIFGFLSSGLRPVNELAIADHKFVFLATIIGARSCRVPCPPIGTWTRA